VLISYRPFLEQNEKLQATETELEEFQRRLREKDLELAELRNELNKSKPNLCPLMFFADQSKNRTSMRLSETKACRRSTTVC
jgi:septal ring factor EnvC (AmiA/AmiB activator)